MSIVKGTVHGVASMVILVLGAILTQSIKENITVFEQLSETTIVLLVENGNLPISEDVAGIVIPVGILMGVWVFLYEVKRATR
jgi:hypothetical protein